MMIDPVAFAMPDARDGLYESFYFRGTSLDGRQAFWLKHNLLRRHGERGVTVENALIIFDRKTGEAEGVYDKEDMSPQAFAAFAKGHHWENTSANFASGSFFDISREALRGKLHTSRGTASWNLQLKRSDDVLYHFPHEQFYRLPWPKKKVITRDCFLRFTGRLSCAGLEAEGEFIGMNGHNWGTEHAHEYAYADCNLFREEPGAYFDGFSVKLALARGLVKTPFLSMASLKLDGHWHHFNAISQVWKQRVNALDDYRWILTLQNATHRLEVAIDGQNPRVEPWVALHYDHPDGRRSVIKNTKFASGRLRLFMQGSNEVLRELNSDYFELETLLPGNLPTAKGYVGIP
ncbi:MAG: hypothetical protein Q8J78_13305 [Moraxellaceae bacterium]|nr:hypothetical protein [Moraxellaceae bacterium]